MSEWLDNLKVGDKVVVYERRPVALTTVKRLTKTLIFTERGSKYRRKDGHAPGEWSTSSIHEPTQEAIDAKRYMIRRSRPASRGAASLHFTDFHTALPILTQLGKKMSEFSLDKSDSACYTIGRRR